MAAVGAASVAVLGPAAAGLATRVAVDGAAMATADAAAGVSAVPRGPIRWLGGRLLSWAAGDCSCLVSGI